MTVIRDYALRGVRPVDGLLFAGPGAAAAAMAEWEQGAALRRLDDGSLVLILARPRVMRCDAGAAVPLISVAGRLVSWPIGADALDALGGGGHPSGGHPTGGGHPSGGEPGAPRRPGGQCEPGAPEGPGAAGGLELGVVPAGAVVRLVHGVVVVHGPGEIVDPVSLLDLRGWRVEPASGDGAAHGAPAAPPPAPPALAVEALPFDGRDKLGHRAPPTRRDKRNWERLQAPKGRPARAPAAGGGGKPLPSGGLPPLLAWLQRRRQRSYLDDLTKLFAAGELDAALRKAIPFGGEAAGPATRPPRKRGDLRIAIHRPPPSGAIAIDAGLRAELEHRYRAAFERLQQEGRVLDAAFVLADLLDRTGEACSFLERHGEVRLAAELAEARSGDHSEVVRLWWRAGERERALAVARRFNCFAPAIWRLEQRGDRVEANAFRRVWMSTLLDAGDLVGAYDIGVVVPGGEAAAIRARLVEVGVEQGGPLGARMLARQLRAADDSPHPAFGPLLADPSRSAERLVLASEVARARTPVDHPAVVRGLARRLLACDRPLDRAVIEKVVALADDPVLRTDLPSLSQIGEPKSQPAEPAWIEIDEGDHGVLPANDARLLPDGRLAVAIAGLGVRMLKPSGQLEAQLDVPADSLVLSDNGLRILAIRHIGRDAISVATIAVPERRIRPLGEIPATVWADTFDGANWFFGHHNQLWQLDMLADGPTALWHQDQHRETIMAIAREGLMLAVAADGGAAILIRRYLLPVMNMVRSPDTTVVGPFRLMADGRVFAAVAADGTFQARLETGEGATTTVVATDVRYTAPVAVVRLIGSARVSARIDSGSLLVFDDRGRIEIVNLLTGSTRSVRLTI